VILKTKKKPLPDYQRWNRTPCRAFRLKAETLDQLDAIAALLRGCGRPASRAEAVRVAVAEYAAMHCGK